MARTDEIKEWWTKALLEQQTSAHPIFGNDLTVSVDGNVVTLSGEVESAEQREEVEREVRRMGTVETVVNRLTVVGPPQRYHLQTIVAVYPDADTARLACQSAASWKLREEREPDILERADEARALLQERARAARVPADRVQRYVDAVSKGKVLLVDRVPEDDALRVVSALEGGSAELIQTLPPEPDTVEAG